MINVMVIVTVVFPSQTDMVWDPYYAISQQEKTTCLDESFASNI
jgi:hypothetical protein